LAPLSTTTALTVLPGNVLIPADVSGVPHDSIADVTQVATIDRTVSGERVVVLLNWCSRRSMPALQQVLGLTDA